MGRDQANPGPAWHATSAHDFDGDGNADILWQNDNGTPAVWLVNLQLGRGKSWTRLASDLT